MSFNIIFVRTNRKYDITVRHQVSMDNIFIFYYYFYTCIKQATLILLKEIHEFHDKNFDMCTHKNFNYYLACMYTYYLNLNLKFFVELEIYRICYFVYVHNFSIRNFPSIVNIKDGFW